MARDDLGTRRTMIQQAAMLFGGVFLLVTIAGFIPGLTTDFDRLDTFGDVGAKLLGIFGINWLENVVHLLYAIAGFAAAKSARTAYQYFVYGGVLYLIVAIYGYVTDIHGDANLIGVNNASNALHVALFGAMVTIGFVLGRDRENATV